MLSKNMMILILMGLLYLLCWYAIPTIKNPYEAGYHDGRRDAMKEFQR